MGTLNLKPSTSKKDLLNLKRFLKYIPRLDEKRVAIKQFIEEGSKLLEQEFDAIVCPLFSGFIPAILFQKLYRLKIKRNLPIFEFAAPSSLIKGQNYYKDTEKYKIGFKKDGIKIVAGIQKDLESFLEKNRLDLNSKIIYIDANVAKGFTLAAFAKTYQQAGLHFRNLTVAITDSRANARGIKSLPRKLFPGGRMMLFNKSNMTNKVFDSVLTPTCNGKGKKFVGAKIIMIPNNLTWYPYYLSLKLFAEEYKNVKYSP